MQPWCNFMRLNQHIILACILCLALGASGNVSDEIHEKCKDVADYMGCVQIFSGQSLTVKESPLDELREAMRILPSRLENTTRRDLTEATQNFSDALALARAKADIADSSLVRNALKLKTGLDGLRTLWDRSI